jgi:hypothetical protein
MSAARRARICCERVCNKLMEVAVDRDALYYPYIHVRDVNWLKATLLSFPQVRRIVPKDFTLNDREEVRPFLSVKGARGEPLVADEPAYQHAAYQAQERFLRRLEAAPPELLRKYTRIRTMKEYPQEVDSFQIHVGKMLPLFDFLKSKKLVWPARQIRANRPHEWYALHPTFGEALMSVIAIAIADEEKLDIVTSSGRVHRALASLNEEAVLTNLLEQTPMKVRMERPQAYIVDELAQVIMLTKFDLSKLTAEQIAELQKDGKDLRRFKNELLTIAGTIPDIPDPVQRKKRLKLAATEVVDRWKSYKRSLPRFAADAVMSAASWKAPDLLTSALAGATSTIMLASGSGLLIGLGVYAGFGVWRGYQEKASSPYQFLSRIEKAGASLSAPPIPNG